MNLSRISHLLLTLHGPICGEVLVDGAGGFGCGICCGVVERFRAGMLVGAGTELYSGPFGITGAAAIEGAGGADGVTVDGLAESRLDGPLPLVVEPVALSYGGGVFAVVFASSSPSRNKCSLVVCFSTFPADSISTV